MSIDKEKAYRAANRLIVSFREKSGLKIEEVELALVRALAQVVLSFVEKRDVPQIYQRMSKQLKGYDGAIQEQVLIILKSQYPDIKPPFTE